MFCPNASLLACVSFVIFILFISGLRSIDVDTEIVNEQTQEVIEHYQQSIEQEVESEQYYLQNLHKNIPKPSEEHLDIERRRIMASKYLDELESVKQEWIDPYDMGGLSLKRASEKIASTTNAPEANSAVPAISEKKDSPSINVKKEELCSSTSKSTFETLSAPKEQCVLDSVYITRWLKKLLLRIEKESGTEYSSISFHLDSDMLESLKQMSSSKTFQVAMLDEVLSNMLAQAEIKQKESYFAVAYTYHTDILKGIAYVSGVALFIYVLHRSFSLRPKLTLLGCAFVINIGWHWMHLYQKIKAHKHAELSSMQIPSQCKKHDLGLLEHMAEYFKSFFTTGECSKYYEALLVDPFWEVSLSVAATEAVTAALFQPLFASSRAVNYFLKQLFEGLPIYLIVFLIIFIFFVTLMKFGYAIKLPLFMGRIEPCHPVAGSRVEELESRTQPTLMDTVLNAVTDTKSTSVKQVLISSEASSSIKTNFTEGSKESCSQSIEYTSNEDGSGKCVYRQNSQTSTFVTAVDSEGFLPGAHGKMISEEGLAVRSGYFEVLSEGEGSKSIQHTFSETEVNVGNKIGSKISNDTTVAVTTSKKPTIVGCLEADVKHDHDLYPSSAQTKDALVTDVIQSHSDYDGMDLNRNDELEVLNLPNCQTDSFEIISRDDISASMHSSQSAGPNCDTSLDLLSKMHRGCKFCNSTTDYSV